MFLKNECLQEEGMVRAISQLVGRRLSVSTFLNFFSNGDRMVLPRSSALESGEMFANGYKISV
jgi:hypothetical protein